MSRTLWSTHTYRDAIRTWGTLPQTSDLDPAGLPPTTFKAAWKLALHSLVAQRYLDHRLAAEPCGRDKLLLSPADPDDPTAAPRTRTLVAGPDFTVWIDPRLKVVRLRVLSNDALQAERPFLLAVDAADYGWPLHDLKSLRRAWKATLPPDPFQPPRRPTA